MHDFFEVLGIPDSARAVDVRRAWARRVRRCHPDFHLPATAISLAAPPGSLAPRSSTACDVAVDFVDASAFVERMQLDFFSGVN